MHDLESVLPGARRAVATYAHAGRELRRLLRAEVEEAQHQRRLRIVADRHAQHRPVAETAFDRFHPTLDLRRDTGFQCADRRELGPILILPRQLQPQILQREQSA